MERKITGVLVDVENKKTEVLEALDTLDNWYKLLDCNTIDIVSRRIGNTKDYFKIICDEEGLYKNNPRIAAIDNFGHTMLVGNIFITGPVDRDGNLTSLSDADVRHIKKNIKNISTKLHPEGYPMLIKCEY